MLPHPSLDGVLIQIQGSAYSGGEPSRRSMSGPAGPLTLPSSAFSGLSTQEHVIARQRRRGFQEPRRQAKVRLRRAILPSTSGAGSSRAPISGHSTDFLAASPSASTYDVGTSAGPISYGDRASTVSSRGHYMSVYDDSRNTMGFLLIDSLQIAKHIRRKQLPIWLRQCEPVVKPTVCYLKGFYNCSMLTH